MPPKNRQRKVNVVEDDAEVKTRRSFTLTDAGMVVLGKPCEAQYYVAQHYPLLTMAILKAGPSVKELLRSIPTYMTARKCEQFIKANLKNAGLLDEDGPDEGIVEARVDLDMGLLEDDEVEDAVAEADGEEKPKPEKAKKPRRKRAKKAPEPEPEPEDEEDEEEEPEEDADETPDYKSMKAPALFKLCKERGLDVKPKQKQSVYIKALEEDDALSDLDDDGDDDDDSWDL